MKLFAFADEADPSLQGQIRAMKRNALDGLEIRAVDGENVSVITLEKAREIRKAMDDAGLVTWSIGSPIGKIKLLEDDFVSDVEKLKHTIEVADVLGAERIRLFSFRMPKGADPAIYKNEVIDRMGVYQECAERSGVLLCHENEKNIYGDTADRCFEILQAIPGIKGVFDPANFVQCGEDTLYAWKLLRDRIDYMHIKDALSDGTVVPPGEGEGNVKTIVSEYLADGKDRFTMEPHLYSFSALKVIEEKGHTSRVGENNRFANADEAFDFAVRTFRSLIA